MAITCTPFQSTIVQCRRCARGGACTHTHSPSYITQPSTHFCMEHEAFGRKLPNLKGSLDTVEIYFMETLDIYFVNFPVPFQIFPCRVPVE